MSKHLLEGRVEHIRDLCRRSLDRDGKYTDQGWLAQSVLNILNGNIDAQIRDEQHHFFR